VRDCCSSVAPACDRRLMVRPQVSTLMKRVRFTSVALLAGETARCRTSSPTKPRRVRFASPAPALHLRLTGAGGETPKGLAGARVASEPSPGRGGSDRALYALVLAAPGVGLLSPSTRFNSERAHLAVLVDPDRGFRNRAPVFDSRQRDRRLACIVRGAGIPSSMPPS
jgi:hypothetical protein